MTRALNVAGAILLIALIIFEMYAMGHVIGETTAQIQKLERTYSRGR